jgi:hypothetical protein
MARVSGEITIARPVEVVFDYVADQSNEPEYNPRMVRAERVDHGLLGPGSQFASAVRSGGRTAPMVIELTAYDRPTLLGSTTTMPHVDIDYLLRFAPAPTGTRMTWSGQVRPKGPLRLLGPVISWVGQRQERRNWRSMKEHLEGTPSMSPSRRWLPEGFFRPVEYAARTRYRRPPTFYRRLQVVARALEAMGLTPAYVVRLEVPGRRTGLVRSSFMVQTDMKGEHFVVALAGESEWVRNVRAAGGRVVLGRGRRRYGAVLTELPVAERAEVIRAYVHRPSPRGRAMTRTGEARHYFGIEPDAPLDEFAAIAGHYPVFRVEQVGLRDTRRSVEAQRGGSAKSSS